MTLAQQFPRDEANAYTKLLQSCGRPGFSEGAVYRFPRGGATVEGPSVKLAREAARCWGNVFSGCRIVTATDERTQIQAFAIDLESNTSKATETSFKNLIYRKNKGWVKPDERDYRELVNKNAAILERNAILQLIPPDIVDDALRAVKDTNRKAAAGEIEQDREASIRRIVAAFSGYGVKREHLEKHLAHTLESISPDELTALRDVFSSIADGNSKASEIFDLAPVGSTKVVASASVSKEGSVAKTVKAKKPKKATHAEAEDSLQTKVEGAE